MSTATVKQAGSVAVRQPELMKSPAFVDSFPRLTPRYQWRNPVMFVVYIGAS